MEPGCDRMSYLEHLLITENTMKVYRRRAEEFIHWCSIRHLDWSAAEELDETLLIAFDEMYFKGLSSEDGSCLLAAIKYFEPQYSRLGDARLPRAHRALKAWSKAAPTQQRLPFPEVALGAVLGVLLHGRQLPLALNLLTQFRTYLRPGACDNLRVKQLIPPNIDAGNQFCYWGLMLNPTEDRLPGKTGTLDDSLMLDTELWLNDFYLMLITNRNHDEYLWPVRGQSAVVGFTTACWRLGLQALRPCRYGLRHGGASEDLASKRRDGLGVKRRGGWRTDSSLKRYAKETRLQAELRKIHPQVIAYGRLVLTQLELFFRHPDLVPGPPFIGRPPEIHDNAPPAA
jgi:hypothetical protein